MTAARSSTRTALRNQIEGNVVQTVSRTLNEELKFDRSTRHQPRLGQLPDPHASPRCPTIAIELIDRPEREAVGRGRAGGRGRAVGDRQRGLRRHRRAAALGALHAGESAGSGQGDLTGCDRKRIRPPPLAADPPARTRPRRRGLPDHRLLLRNPVLEVVPVGVLHPVAAELERRRDRASGLPGPNLAQRARTQIGVDRVQLRPPPRLRCDIPGMPRPMSPSSTRRSKRSRDESRAAAINEGAAQPS